MASAPLARVAVLALGLFVGGGCADRDQPTAPPPGEAGPARASTTVAPPGGSSEAAGTTSMPGTTGPTADPPRLRAIRVAPFDGALALAVRTGDQSLYVAEQGGLVKALRGGRVDTTPVLDLRREVSAGGERGLLGLAFSPDGSRLYAHYTDRDGDTRVVEFAMGDGSADPASRRLLLAVDQPFANHNGGQLAFGPDGMLYIGLGDGGGGGDPSDNGQRLDTLLGKILRIDPRPSGDRPYAVPADNPFIGRRGARPEIWAYGLRNPWRFSFDRQTGSLWIGDVGQGSREEIDAAAPGSKGGENYGWNRFEGTERFSGRAPADNVAPVFDYANGDGNCAVTGGYVYRGRAIPGLQGRYVFADYCRGQVLALVPEGSGLRSVPLGPEVDALASFGEDGAGELYVLSLAAGLFRLEAAG